MAVLRSFFILAKSGGAGASEAVEDHRKPGAAFLRMHLLQRGLSARRENVGLRADAIFQRVTGQSTRWKWANLSRCCAECFEDPELDWAAKDVPGTKLNLTISWRES